MKLAFGLNAAIPAAVTAAWGARWIFPDDFVWDRQDLKGPDNETYALKVWLNDTGLKNARTITQDAVKALILEPNVALPVILYSDQIGVVVANTNASYGYLYVAAWLHKNDPAKQPGPEFKKIELPTVSKLKQLKLVTRRRFKSINQLKYGGTNQI